MPRKERQDKYRHIKTECWEIDIKSFERLKDIKNSPLFERHTADNKAWIVERMRAIKARWPQYLKNEEV